MAWSMFQMDDGSPVLHGLWHLEKNTWLLDSTNHPRWLINRDAAEAFRLKFHRGEPVEVRPLPEDVELHST